MNKEMIQRMHETQDTAGLLCEAYRFFNNNTINNYLRIMIGSWRYGQ